MADATAASGTRAIAVTREHRLDGAAPLYAQPDWLDRFPWLAQGTTGRGENSAEPFDLGLFGSSAAGRVLERWRVLRTLTGCPTAVHSRQVHGAAVHWHDAAPHGLIVDDGRDGHATRRAGILLAISVADCVPVFVVDPTTRAIALLHAGWRGTASGVLEAGVRTLERRAGASADRLWIHLGPAICGRCYEVGPEVHDALGLAPPPAPAPVDLRAVLAGRARALGVADERITISDHCTRCGGGEGAESASSSPFFSHRGGDGERQMAVMGVRPSSPHTDRGGPVDPDGAAGSANAVEP